MPAVRQRRRGAFGGRARGDGPRPARAVRAGIPGAASGIPAARISSTAGISPATTFVRLSLTVGIGVSLGAAVV